MTFMKARALGIGVALGMLAAISNLYVSLRTGWSLPVMTTAALVGIALLRKKREPQEITTLTATASAAGYMAGGGNAAALPALMMLAGGRDRAPSLIAMTLAWIAIAIAGTLVAPLFRSKTIDGDQPLPFPTATATATLNEGSNAPRVLLCAAIASGALALIRRLARLPATIAFPPGGPPTFGIDLSFVLIGAGALMTLRTAASTLGGAVVTYGFLVPKESTYRDAVAIMVWPSAALLVTSALTSLALTSLDVAKMFRQRTAAVVVGKREWSTALVVAMAVVILIMTLLLHLQFWHVLVAVPLAFALAFVAARAMGETDIVPTKALTPLAQLLFGVLPGASLTTTTLLPNMTSGIALHAADTLGSLKVAKMSNTPERTTLIARVIGVVVGGVAVALAYSVVVRDASSLPNSELPVPAVLVWKSVAALSIDGISALPLTTRISMTTFALIGIIIAILERVLPPRFARFLPSPVGIGSGMVLPASSSVAICLGSILSKAVKKDLVIPLASGLIAGESLVGIVGSLLM
jgi:uncharacterized oligopeptide transporter (OPT) family protein